MLSRPYAFNCILRLRTSTEFKPGHSVSAHLTTFGLSYWGIVILQFLLSHLFFPVFCSMDTSSQIHNMKMFSTLFVVILMQHMLMTSILLIMLDFPGMNYSLQFSFFG